MILSNLMKSISSLNIENNHLIIIGSLVYFKKIPQFIFEVVSRTLFVDKFVFGIKIFGPLDIEDKIHYVNEDDIIYIPRKIEIELLQFLKKENSKFSEKIDDYLESIKCDSCKSFLDDDPNHYYGIGNITLCKNCYLAISNK